MSPTDVEGENGWDGSFMRGLVGGLIGGVS